MDYDPKAFFHENEYEYVNSFIIIEADDGRYRIAEKWRASEDDEHTKSEDVWMDYHVSESDLLTRIEDGHCSHEGHISDEQYAAVCRKIGESDTAERVIA